MQKPWAMCVLLALTFCASGVAQADNEPVSNFQHLWAAGHASNPHASLRMKWGCNGFTPAQWDMIPGASNCTELNGLPFTITGSLWTSINGAHVYLKSEYAGSETFSMWTDEAFTETINPTPDEYAAYGGYLFAEDGGYLISGHVVVQEPEELTGEVGDTPDAKYFFENGQGTLNLSDGHGWIITFPSIDLSEFPVQPLGAEPVSNFMHLWAAGHASNPYETLQMKWGCNGFNPLQWAMIEGASTCEDLDGKPFTIVGSLWESINGAHVYLHYNSPGAEWFTMWADQAFTQPINPTQAEYDAYGGYLFATDGGYLVPGHITSEPPGSAALNLNIGDEGCCGWEKFHIQIHSHHTGLGGHLLQAYDKWFSSLETSHGLNPGDGTEPFDVRVTLTQNPDATWNVTPAIRLSEGEWADFWDGSFTSAEAFNLTDAMVQVQFDPTASGTVRYAIPTAESFLPEYNGPDWYVATTGSDTEGNGSEKLPFRTIQHAIDQANPGDMIHVAAGTYNENPNINKANLTIRGEDKAATIILVTSSSGMAINADGVTLDSVTVKQNAPATVQKCLYIGLSAWVSGVTVTNCVFDGTGSTKSGSLGIMVRQADDVTIDNVESFGWCYGIDVYNPSPPAYNVVISNSTFHDNQWMDVGIDRSIDVRVQGCDFTGNSKRGVLAMGKAAQPVTGCEITGNTFSSIQQVDGSGGEAILVTADGVLVDGNEVHDCYIALRITTDYWPYELANNNTVTGNHIHNNHCGVLVDYGTYVEPTGNVFHHNSFIANANGFDASTLTAPLDATSNWWGSYAGPGGTDAGGRTGDSVFGPVNADPITLGEYGVDSDGDGTDDDVDTDDDNDGYTDTFEVARGSDPLNAGSIPSWRGIVWNAPYGTIYVTEADTLEVSTTSIYATSAWGAAHYNTPQSFRNAASQWIQATFADQGPGTIGGQIWFEHEPMTNHAWGQLGCWQSREEYRAYWWNAETDEDGWCVIGPRTAGEHTVKVGKRADGTVDYWFDGVMVFSTAKMTPGYLGDVYLAAHSTPEHGGDTLVFTDYQWGTDYQPMPLSLDLSGDVHTQNPSDPQVGDWLQVGPLGPNGSFAWGSIDDYSAPAYMPPLTGDDLDMYGWAMEGTLDGIDGDTLNYSGEFWVCPEGYGYNTKDLAIEHCTFTLAIDRITGEAAGSFLADEGTLQPPGWPAPVDFSLANPGSFQGTLNWATGAFAGTIAGEPDVSDANLLALNVPDVYVRPGETVAVTLDVSNLMQSVNGCQAVVGYVTDHLTLTGISAGADDWDALIYPEDLSYLLHPGELDVAVGVKDGLGVIGTRADGTIAVFTFTAGDEGLTYLEFRPDISEVECTIFADIWAQAVYPAKQDSPTIYIDGTGPTITRLEADPATWTNAGSVQITFEATDDNAGIETYELLVDGALDTNFTQVSPYSLDVSGLADGERQVTLRVTDKAGNTGTATISIQLDKTPPNAFSPTADPPGWTNADTITIGNFETTDDTSSVVRYEISIGGDLKGTVTGAPYEFALSTAGLADGTHSVDVTAFDEAENSRTESVNIYIDKTPPLALSPTADPAGWTNAFTITIDGFETTDETSGIDRYEISVGGVLKAAVSGAPWLYDPYADNLPDGVHAVDVTAFDEAGNTRTGSVNIYFDKTGPVITSVTAEQYGVDLLPGTPSAVQDDVSITVTATDATSGISSPPTVIIHGVAAAYDGIVDNGDGTFTYAYTYAVTASTPNGTAAIEVTVVDNAGNSTFDDTRTFNVNKNQIAGDVELQLLVGGITRTVTFVVTHGAGTVTADVDVVFPAGSPVGPFRLVDLPDDVSAVSAKAAWNLRRKLPASLDPGTGQATVNFTGAGNMLLGGDINGTNTINILDYSLMKINWFKSAPDGAVADINGDGQVSIPDYTIMKLNWFKAGDEE